MNAVMTQSRPRQNQAGFTFVEILVVLFIFGLGMYMVTLLFSSIQASQRNSYYAMVAANAAKSEIERIRTTQFDSVTDGQTFTNSLPDTLPAGKLGVVNVSVPANAPNSKKIDVTVSYPIGVLTRSVVLTAIIDEPENEQ